MLDKRVKGHVFEEEWVDIIKYMYNQEDALAVIVLLRKFMKCVLCCCFHPARSCRSVTPVL